MPEAAGPPRWVFGLAVASWLALAVAAAVHHHGETLDDIYITYRYARNLADGAGFVFNPGERVFGTTAPGMGLLLALARLVSGVPIEVLGTWSTAVALVALAVLLLARSGRRWPESLVGGTLLVPSAFLWFQNGSEAQVSLALLAAAAVLAGRRPGVAGTLAGFAAWCRPDGALAVGLLGLLRWRETRRLPRRYGWAAAATLGAGVLCAWAWFGRPLPVTLEAKRLQAAFFPQLASGGWRFWIAGLIFLGRIYTRGALYTFLLVGAAGLPSFFRHGGRPARLLCLYGLSVAVAYPLLGVPYFTWYTIAPLVPILYGVAYAAGGAARAVGRFFAATAAARVAAAGVAALLLYGSVAPALVRSWVTVSHPAYFPRVDFYRRVGLWLADHMGPEEEVAYVEVGTLGYYSGRRVRDLLGLVSTGVLPELRRGDVVGAFLAHPTSLVIYDSALDGMMGPIRAQPWFAAAYEEVRRFELSGLGETLVVYRRRPGAALPSL